MSATRTDEGTRETVALEVERAYLGLGLWMPALARVIMWWPVGAGGVRSKGPGEWVGEDACGIVGDACVVVGVVGGAGGKLGGWG